MLHGEYIDLQKYATRCLTSRNVGPLPSSSNDTSCSLFLNTCTFFLLIHKFPTSQKPAEGKELSLVLVNELLLQQFATKMEYTSLRYFEYFQ